MSHVTAKFVFDEDTVYEVDLPAEGAVPLLPSRNNMLKIADILQT